MMPNEQVDLDKVTDLFDRISTAQGGTKEIGGLWATERSALILEVTAQIVTFQTMNRRPVVDGVIDPTGGTLKLMNTLATAPTPGGGISATVVPAPAGYQSEAQNVAFPYADVISMPGTNPLRPTNGGASYVRRLVRVEGCSINWFGVLFPKNDGTVLLGRVPLVYFTPHPSQGGYLDPSYDSFGGSPPWGRLWHDYTWGVGRFICATGADQVLVIPFYRNSQHRNLGDFLSNWKEAVSAVVTAAIVSVDPLALRTDSYTFDRICSCSFSDGWLPHQAFNTQGAGAAAMTNVLFDIDGQAAKPPSHWRPANGVIFLDRPPPRGVNPIGTQWYVGGRWQHFAKIWPGGTTHAYCSSYLLYFGLWQYCT
jgi:hypothetical protein